MLASFVFSNSLVLQILSRFTPSGLYVSIRGAAKRESQPEIEILLNCSFAYRVGDPTFY
jgi:hypothetical protein